MELKVFFLYLVTWALLALTPGPAVMFSASQAMRHGFRASLAGISGIQCGNFIFFVCIALGLASVLATATVAFTTLRIAGAIYLFYIGARLILSSFGDRAVEKTNGSTPTPAPSHRNVFLQGLAIQLTNPKALLFVSALVPQFINPQRPLLPQIVILTATTIVVDLGVLSTYAFCAERGMKSFRHRAIVAWLERMVGAALIFFGFRLLAARK